MYILLKGHYDCQPTKMPPPYGRGLINHYSQIFHKKACFLHKMPKMFFFCIALPYCLAKVLWTGQTKNCTLSVRPSVRDSVPLSATSCLQACNQWVVHLYMVCKYALVGPPVNIFLIDPPRILEGAFSVNQLNSCCSIHLVICCWFQLLPGLSSSRQNCRWLIFCLGIVNWYWLLIPALCQTSCPLRTVHYMIVILIFEWSGYH